MNEKTTKTDKMTNSSKPVPMKLFAAWEVDRTPSNCIPRLCTLRVTRLRVVGGDPVGVGVVSIAARMHSSKRTLRSNDIQIPPFDVELDLCFSLQYPHFVKRDGNKLQIMLQRRKKYKNRTILGYKTLAEGVIRMDQVLQRSMDMELELTSVGGKGSGVGGGAGGIIARLSITGLTSTPVDHDNKNNNTVLVTDRGDSDEEEEFSSVEETDDVTYGAQAAARRRVRQIAFKQADLSYTKFMGWSPYQLEASRFSNFTDKTNERDSDSEPDLRRSENQQGPSNKQRNLKQKFAALLRRFKMPEELSECAAARNTAHGGLEVGEQEIDELFQELESLSCGEDSGPEQLDTISIGSTPKPSLRPFFSSSRSLVAPQQRNSGHTKETRRQSSVPAGVTLAPVSASRQPRQRRHASTGNEEERERSAEEGGGGGSEGSDPDPRAAADHSPADLSSSPPRDKEEKRSRLFRSATSGGNMTVNSAQALMKKKNSLATDLRPISGLEYSIQSPTAADCWWSSGNESELLCAVASSVPLALVNALTTLDLNPNVVNNAYDLRCMLQALLTRASKIRGRGCRVLLCGGDAIVAWCVRAHTELAARRPHDASAPLRFYILPAGSNIVSRHLSSLDSTYASLFGSESWFDKIDSAEVTTRISRYLNGMGATANLPIGEAMVSYREKSIDEDSSQTFVPFISEVRVGACEPECDDARNSPPTLVAPIVNTEDALELHLDYWQCSEGGTTEPTKVSVKGPFKCLQVLRQQQQLYLTYLTKEKKQKIMRLGKKKEKEREGESGRGGAGVARLICSPRPPNSAPLKVYIDGTEWNGVKFFQLSTQWQTHVKHFPVATCGSTCDQ